MADAGRAAALDLVLKTGPAAIAEERVVALADAKQLLGEVQSPARRARTGIGPEVTALAMAGATVKAQPRILLVAGQVQVGVTLVVAQHHVVAGPQGFDQIALQQQRFALGAGYRHVNGLDLPDQRPRLGRIGALAEIAGNALPEVSGLAHVEDLAGGVVHPVNTGAGGQTLEERLRLKVLHQFVTGSHVGG